MYAIIVYLVVDCYHPMMELICSIFLQYDFSPLDQKCKRASLVAQLVKNPPAVQETPVQFLGREGPLEKGKATHSSILRLPWWLSW